ncbi:hypothetical protein MACK_003525 [Theileria orientalis]|uniref:Uncharacterized protein n=1 Tax=Theileria orientalis TaxID=68886 RepID=A0A976SJC2_THEOR|nr:hypothetical protein MACK_003525 [Theileria orientalis]
MNMFFLAMVAVATVSAAPFVLDHTLVENNGHAKLAVFHHVSAVTGNGANANKLRFVHLMPKVTYLGDFADGLASAHFGGVAKKHDFLHMDEGEVLVEVLGLSNCHDWHVAVLGVWHAASGALFHKHYAGEHGHAVKVLGGLADLVDFVNLKLETGHLGMFNQLVAKGLPSHLFTHKLQHRLAARLPLAA